MEEELVQYAIRIREQGVSDEELIKKYFWIPKRIVQKTVTNRFTSSDPNEKDIVIKNYHGTGADVLFFRKMPGSLVITASPLEARECARNLFNLVEGEDEKYLPPKPSHPLSSAV